MDSTSGHSENPQRRKNNLEDFYKNLKENGEMYQMNMEDLSQEDQEIMMNLMEEEPPPMYGIKFVVDDLTIIPDVYLKEILEELLKKDAFEQADEVLNVLKERGLEINISSENHVTIDGE